MKTKDILVSDFVRLALTVKATFPKRYFLPFDGPVGMAPKTSFLGFLPGKHIKTVTPHGATVSQEAWFCWHRWAKMLHSMAIPRSFVSEFKQAARWAAKRKRAMSNDEFERVFLATASLLKLGLAEPPPEQDPPAPRRRGRPAGINPRPTVFANSERNPFSQGTVLDDPAYIEWFTRDNAMPAEYDEPIPVTLPKSGNYKPEEDLSL